MAQWNRPHLTDASAAAGLKKRPRSHFTAEASVYGPEGKLIANGEGRFVTMKKAEAKKVVGK
jgi:hypothetical protein